MEEKQYYKEKRISSSSLKYFELSPLMFKKFLNSEIEFEEKSYLTKGKQIHMAILEPKLFRKYYTSLDFETPKSEQQKKFCEDYIKLYYENFIIHNKTFKKNENFDENLILQIAYKNNYKTTAKDDKILELAKELLDKLSRYISYLKKRKKYKDVLSRSTWKRIKDLKENCVLHKKANDLLSEKVLANRNVYNELVIFWEHPLHDLPCKSMIDRLIIDHDKKTIMLVDLKTANTFHNFKERCNEFNYFRQMAFYWYAVTWYLLNELKLDIKDYKHETYIIALKTVDEPEVKVYNITEQHLIDGESDLIPIFTDLKWHWETDQWDYTRSYYNGDGDERL